MANSKSASFNVRYDASADVLYISTFDTIAAKGREAPNGIVWRYDRDGHLIGATVLDFYELWFDDQETLAGELSAKFEIPLPTAEVVVNRALELHDQR